MIPQHIYDQFMILELLWLCVLLPLAWASPDTPRQTKPYMSSTPCRQRSSKPKPFAGLSDKPHSTL